MGRAHFGGFGDKDEDETDHNVRVSHSLDRNVVIIVLQSDRKKSKAEVMAEVIAKSKEHKVIYWTHYQSLPDFGLGTPSTGKSTRGEYAAST